MKTITLTNENIRSLSTHPSGQGFNKEQVVMMGFTWPPPKGWIRKIYNLVGTVVDESQYLAVLHAGDRLRERNRLRAQSMPKGPSFHWGAGVNDRREFDVSDFTTA